MKAFSLFFLLAASLCSFAQSDFEILDAVNLSNDYEGGEYEMNIAPTSGEVEHAMWLVYHGSTPITIRCKRTETDVCPNTYNRTCWKICPPNLVLAGDYPYMWVNVSANVLLEDFNPGDTITTFAPHFDPAGQDSCSLFTYEFYNDTDLTTALAEVRFRFNHGTGACTASTPEYELDFSVAPNPASDEVYIQAEQQLDEVTLFDLQGKEIIRLQPNAIFYNLNVSEIPSGIYILHVSGADGKGVKKLVIE